MKEKLSFVTQQKISLNEYLRTMLSQEKSLLDQELSNSKIRRLIVAGAVSVNGHTVTRPAFELRGKSQVCVEFDTDKFFFEKQPDDIQFEVTDSSVLYEDENLIFINKPAFFPVEQTITGSRANLHDAVVDYLWKRDPSLRNPPYVGIMHRLDRTTSGVIVFTKNRSVNKAVSEVFQSHNLTKKYLAVCPVDASRHAELVSASPFTVEMFMARVSPKSQTAKWGQVPEQKGGQYSKTEFRVLKELTVENTPCLLVECTLFTGRTHQIRVHLASQGLPILGDTLYGAPPAKRIYLHSHHLAFEINNKLYAVTSEFPNYK
ncbi:MAG: RluA family pseudouridine synthase [Treponema sp.]|nr:RluA family pseudouridine synthase [Treponema sp.]